MSKSCVVTGTIWTGDPRNPRAEALRVVDDRIVQVGARSFVAPAKDEDVWDFGSCLVTPGFTDSHIHFGAYARAGMYPDCGTANSLEELLEFLRAQVKDAAPGQWIRCVNFIELNWKRPAVPSRLQLDGVAPETPLLVSHYGAHFHVANTKAFELSGLWDSHDPEIERGADGLPTGLVRQRRRRDDQSR